MFNTMHIGKKLVAAFLLVILLFIATLLWVGSSLTQVMGSVRQIRNESLPFVLVVEEMNASPAGGTAGRVRCVRHS